MCAGILAALIGVFLEKNAPVSTHNQTDGQTDRQTGFGCDKQ